MKMKMKMMMMMMMMHGRFRPVQMVLSDPAGYEYQFFFLFSKWAMSVLVRVGIATPMGAIAVERPGAG
jgi:hypothetical protein